MPSALSITPRMVRLVISQPSETPFSSTLPPDTVSACQNLRRMCGPSITVNSQSSIATSEPGCIDAFRMPVSIGVAPSTPPGLIASATLANAPSGMRSEDRWGSASLRSNMAVVLACETDVEIRNCGMPIRRR
ncbi:hypothetical protein BN961_03119 [Afipia felis]|uniref:Uncharacterized protein n=1 Tax=Afipia felis TaxID=1035 RepID=A0A090MV01_AFIFE|nr:hypothetical protein BN961_03119 [Afipia felis]